MKKFVFAIAMLISFSVVSQQARAQQMFSLNASCDFNGGHGGCQVFNTFPRPVYCQLTANGVLASGYFAYGYNNLWVQPGMTAWVSVDAPNPYRDPLVNVWGSANCWF